MVELHNTHLHSTLSDSPQKYETIWEMEYFIELSVPTLHFFENEVLYLFCKGFILFVNNRLCFFQTHKLGPESIQLHILLTSK